MLPDHWTPKPPRIGGCLTCRYGGPLINDPRNPLTDNRCVCTRPKTWPATIPADGCSGWEREPGSDDEIHDSQTRA